MSDEKKVVDAEVVEMDVDTSALSVVTKAEIDTQIATAKQYPRSITKFLAEAREMATLDQDTSGRMYYRLKRRGKDGVKVIEGPSIRLAEVAVAAWGNTFVMSRPVAVEEKVVRCQGLAWDLERNNRRVFEVTRRITGTDGRRYTEDMILVTQQAASQIAARNAVFGVIPRVYVDRLLRDCKAVFIGQKGSIEDKRKTAFSEFEKIGASKADVLSLAGRPGVEDLTIDDLIDLKGILTAIEDGNLTLKEAIAAVQDDGGTTVVTPQTLSVESITKPEKVEAQDDGKPKEEPKIDPPKEKPKASAEKPKPAPKPTPAPKAPPEPVEIEEIDPEDADVDSLFRQQ